MENKVFHAVLAAFGAGVSIKDGLAFDTIYGVVHATQAGDTLYVTVAEPSKLLVDYTPTLVIHNVSHVPAYAITATMKLMFR